MTCSNSWGVSPAACTGPARGRVISPLAPIPNWPVSCSSPKVIMRIWSPGPRWYEPEFGLGEVREARSRSAATHELQQR